MIRGDKALAELAEQFEGDPTQITEWKKQLHEHAAEVFGTASRSKNPPVDVKVLRARIGKLSLADDFFRRCAYQGERAER